ncbi:prolyl oligopeptidase family serine peptidase [Roseateles sp. BYS78W]|uniref:Prolyl oligopeptidase family serine peptidase n=1 Tax=Pelomonas candidula TaxID=3299025 RepID=A0ABW7HJT6_9BURK
MQFPLLAPLLAGLLGMLTAVGACAADGPTVRDVVEFTAFVQPRNNNSESLRQQVSPDGTRAFFVTRKANVASDRNRYEIRLLDISSDVLASGEARAPELVFSFESDQDYNFGDPAIDRVRWWDDKTLVFMGRLKDGQEQVYRLDLLTHDLQQLTWATTPIVSFAASADLRRVLYAAQVPNPPLKAGARSFVMADQSVWSAKFGQNRLASQIRKYGFFVADAGATQPRALGEPFFMANLAPPQVSISPDGRWALLPRYEPQRTLDWSRQYPMVAEIIAAYGPAVRNDPLRYYSGSRVQSARRKTVWRLDDGLEQTVVDAPDDSQPAGFQERPDHVWQGGGTSVVLAGTHLPLGVGGNTSTASHVIEYWPDTGRWTVVAKLANRLDRLLPRREGFAVIDGARRREFRRDGAGWREIAGQGSEASSSAWTLRVRESLNEPPDIVADGPADRSIRLTTLNPQFDAATWGVMRTYTWRDAKGREWRGGLMGGEEGGASKRLPLIIETYAYSPDNFYLQGPNASSRNGTSAFAGRAFLREGFLVLAMGKSSPDARIAPDQSLFRLFNEGVRGAVDALVKEGRVDPARVGIIGWSTTGERVLNLVTFSDLPIRAATLADGDANTQFFFTMTYGFTDSAWAWFESVNEGLPFGPGRANWLRNDPALNTDCVNTALRIESYGVPLYSNYDIYALLRRQFKPVEMVLIPGGAHSLSTPSERMVSLQGNVDWFRFWLKGESRTEPFLAGETSASLQAQYDAWRQMETMKAANDKLPRCEREASRG